jgi:hypothetical protein
MKRFISNYGGIIAGALYGLCMRLFFDRPSSSFFTDLFSVTFELVLPVLIGIIPIMFASKEQLSSMRYYVGRPIYAVLLFFIVCYVTDLEDIICILIISIPFTPIAAISGILFARIIRNYKEKKGYMFSLILLPLFTGVAEKQFDTPSNTYTINTSVITNAAPDKIWEHVVRVKPIKETEYDKGFFNYAGIPRPLYAELNRDTIGSTRTGYFEGGLVFTETVTHWERNKEVSFDIQVVPSSIRQTVFDKHILQGGHFKFLNASYRLTKINSRQTELILSSSYQLDSKVNAYGSFWGNKLLVDFQGRLLEVIKDRCEEI